MIGRATQGTPWLISHVHEFLTTGIQRPEPSVIQITDIMRRHLHDIHQFYGDTLGVRIARKHLGWYCRHLPAGTGFKQMLYAADDAEQQVGLLDWYINQYLEGLMGKAA